MKCNLTWLAAIILLVTRPLCAQDFRLDSPDGVLTAMIDINGGISISLSKEGISAIKLQNISLETSMQTGRDQDFKIQKAVRNSVSEIIEPEIREKAETFQNSYNELEIRFRGDHSIFFRLYNEGFAFRHSTSASDSLKIYRENLEILLEENDSAWFQSSKSFNSAWETPYEHSGVREIKKGQLCNLPLLIEKNDGRFIMVTEADLFNYPGLWLEGTGESKLSAVNAPLPDALTGTGRIYGRGQVAGTHDFIAGVTGSRSYPWRIIAVADNEKGLVQNNMVYLLSSPCSLDDISWIRPGVVMFDWWAKNSIYGVDFKAGINTETAKYFIDFCAGNGFRYFLFDDGWCPRDNLLEEIPGLDMEEVTAYGKEKDVDVMVWMIWRTLQLQWDEAFDRFEKWGIKGIKVDFMNRDDQQMVQFYEAVARKSAERKMVVDFHGAYKPSGLRRKYPNVLTREALIEFEYNGWTNSDDPVHHNLLPYIRMFTGPMDYIPATMRNSTKDNFRPVGDYPMGQGTRAHSIALFVVLSSPMTMLPDSPSDYYREKECTEFISRIPVIWDETRLLDGKIAEYTVLARRSGNEWFVGAITNWNEREIVLATDFLKPGKYRLVAVADGLNADKRAEDYRKVETEFTRGESLKLSLAPGGGWVARISPVLQTGQ